MQLQSSLIDVDDFTGVQELFHSRGWTDGLPVVPSTADDVQACLEWALTPADLLLGVGPVREQPVTAEKVAINAVMAGCLPMHFPALVTTSSAMLQPEFLLHGATSSTGGCAIFIVINGDIRRELDSTGGFSALGGNDRASNVIVCAIRLGLINIFDVRPGGVDRFTLGHPGKINFCVAEDEERTSGQ